MAGWGGFTEEDLLALKNESVQLDSCRASLLELEDSNLKPKAATTLEGNSKKKPRERLLRISSGKQTIPLNSLINPVKSSKPTKPLTKVKDTVSHTVTVTPVALETDQMPALDKGRKCVDREEHIQPSIDEHVKTEANTQSQFSSDIKNKENYETERTHMAEEEEKPSKDMEMIIGADKELDVLQLSIIGQLQLKQNQMEEENKKRKKIIKEAIRERYSKAQNEAQVLQDVQKELNHLDHILAKDVEILRTKIEEATMTFNHAQRRYKKAEEEFVQAKLDVHVKGENKDLLTQHLYTIIQENELRKATKLDELMGKLNLSQEKTSENVSNNNEGMLVPTSGHKTCKDDNKIYINISSRTEDTDDGEGLNMANS